MYNNQHLLKDLKSSVVVFLVALPLCLGISLASGAPLVSGILAGIVGGIVVGALSSSHTSVAGPAAGLTVIVLTAIESLGDFTSFTLAVVVAGVLQIIFGLLKAGKLGAYFPNSVIKGMLAAIGLILILKQIPHFLGIDSDFMGDMAFEQQDGFNTFSEIWYAIQSINVGVIIISFSSLFLMIGWEKMAKKGNKFFQTLPAPLLAVLLGVILNEWVFAENSNLAVGKEHLVALPFEGGFQSFFNSFELPQWSELGNWKVYQVALTLAIVASLETLLSVEAIDKIDPQRRVTNKNRELLAQGLGNTVAGLIGALPVTSVIVRSSANIGSGNASKMSAILHGLWMLLAVSLAPFYLELIPLASLSAILILIGYKLAPPQLFRQMQIHGKEQFLPFIITIFAILMTDLLMGILIGMVAGFFFVIRSSHKKSIVVVNEDSRYLIRFMKDVSFLQKPLMQNILQEIPQGAFVVIDGSNHLQIDRDIIGMIEDFVETSEERSIKCEIVKSSLAMNEYFKA
ncbi:MAG: SulP family inorganic anion transporter [Halobacteriovoraceae bacterium]|nr:SulP family inorganic anion transporter [Halobacteriovoraceae bacterium]MCB9095300.1 SulP family inorganic anion transporter [Halobacteriovoraceae bacterium]